MMGTRGVNGGVLVNEDPRGSITPGVTLWGQGSAAPFIFPDTLTVMTKRRISILYREGALRKKHTEKTTDKSECGLVMSVKLLDVRPYIWAEAKGERM